MYDGARESNEILESADWLAGAGVAGPWPKQVDLGTPSTAQSSGNGRRASRRTLFWSTSAVLLCRSQARADCSSATPRDRKVHTAYVLPARKLSSGPRVHSMDVRRGKGPSIPVHAGLHV